MKSGEVIQNGIQDLDGSPDNLNVNTSRHSDAFMCQ